MLKWPGTGPDVLMVHGPAFSAPSWGRLARELQADACVYAIDLPGHGQSPVELVDTDHGVESVAAAIESLGLDRPVLVGIDVSAHTVLAVAVGWPHLVGGLVCIGSLALYEPERLAQMIAFADTDGLQQMVADRFLFGFRGMGQSDRQHVIDTVVGNSADYYLTADMGSAIGIEVDWCIWDLPDGTFIHRPDPRTLREAIVYRSGSPWYPDVTMYDRLTVPTAVVISTGGQDATIAPDAAGLSKRNPLITGGSIESGAAPHYTHPELLARVVRDVISRRTAPAE